MAAALLASSVQAQLAGCVVSTQSLAFGAYDVSSASALTSSARLDVRCGTAVTLTLGLQSRNIPAAGQSRALLHLTSGEILNYGLFQDSALTQVWGDGLRQPGRVVVVSGTSSIFVYGSVPPGQDPPIGEYRDQLSVVVLP